MADRQIFDGCSRPKAPAPKWGGGQPEIESPPFGFQREIEQREIESAQSQLWTEMISGILAELRKKKEANI